ncbi:hypothetical protein RB653_006868 [Dictyostelium firmibasis]|uniref:Aminopeptidase n=1 Tax=Dictyostelium firmibasis TaxID=79012 RepID=A0AAN7YLK3_9MYCE
MCKYNDHKYLVEKVDRLVLPENVVPIKYDLHLKPNLKEFTFKGEETITVQVKQPTKTITMHSIEIEIQSASLKSKDSSSSSSSKSITFYEPEEVVIFEFENELQVGEHYLTIAFTGLLNDKLRGFYRSKYTIKGEDRYLATTQFEATDARRSFPCFDEPAHKAVFNISLTVSDCHTAISNMEEKSITNNNDATKTYVFEQTPIMSTYLVAYIVGDLEYIEGKTKGGIRVRVYKANGVEGESEFALDTGIRAMDYFIDYFNVPYPLTKCDHVAVPDFAAGAMENWGLITYRDVILLTSDKTTLATKQDIVGVIGHELAHQWFGNLVTMEWWSQLWLNEGFATFMGYLVTDYLYPKWNVFLEFSQSYRNSALSLDALDNSHAIEVPVRSSAEISEIFDDISYNKGSCVIQMVESRFGESFRKGLHHYLTKHSYKNTITEDLWASISKESGIDVDSFVRSFTKYPGYPVVTIKETGKEGEFSLTQKKFRSDGEVAEKSDDPIWNCFIKFQTKNGPFEFTLTKKSDTVTIPNYKKGDWIKPNYGQCGYYRIEYTAELIKSLVPVIETLELPAQDRLGLLSDCYYLCKNGSIPISSYMELVFSYQNETDSDVWTFIIKSLDEISELSFDQSYKSDLEELIRKLLKPLSQRLGFQVKEGESSSDTLLRNKVNTYLGKLGDKDIVNEAKKRFEQFKLDQSSLPSDIRSSVLVTVVKNGGEVEQQEIINRYLASNDIAEKSGLLSVVCQSPSDELVLKALKFSVSKDVRSCESYMLWRVSNQFKPVVWKYFTENFKAINEMFNQNVLFAYMITFSLSSKMSEQQLQQVEDFFKQNPVPIADRSIKQDLEQIRNNTKWFNSFNKDLLKWIKK